MVVADFMQEQFRDWDPAPLWPSTIANDGFLSLCEIAEANHLITSVLVSSHTVFPSSVIQCLVIVEQEARSRMIITAANIFFMSVLPQSSISYPLPLPPTVNLAAFLLMPLIACMGMIAWWIFRTTDRHAGTAHQRQCRYDPK